MARYKYATFKNGKTFSVRPTPLTQPSPTPRAVGGRYAGADKYGTGAAKALTSKIA